MISQLHNNPEDFLLKASRPRNYPIPVKDDLLFFIQRNGSLNTVVYELNLKHGKINNSNPMTTYWIRYSESGEEMALNYIQNKLAYGYNHEFINDESFEFNMVCYPNKKFYVGKNKTGKYQVATKIDGEMSYLNCIYAVVEEWGVFPNVKYVELWGSEMNGDFEVYEKIII